MLILGLNAYNADASAAILENGNLTAAVEEERFTRIKHSAGFPYNGVTIQITTVKTYNILQFVEILTPT